MVVISVIIKAHFRLPSVPQKTSPAKAPYYCQARAGEFPRNNSNCYFNRMSRCHAFFSIFRGELQNVTKEPGKLLQIPSWISTTRKVQYWQVHFLNVNILQLKICM